MITSSMYRDLLWYFGISDPGLQSEVLLRVFKSESELVLAGGDAFTGYPVTLPFDWSANAKEGRWTGMTAPPPDDLLLKTGRQLWEGIPEDARTSLLEAIPEQPCRLRISSASTAINDLPWEWLNDGNQPFALRPSIRLERSVPVRVPVPPLTITPPIKVLLVFTNAKDARMLYPWQEIGAVLSRLEAPPYNVKVLEEASWDALAAALRDGPHILHYIGHAGLDRGGGNLILHDSRNMTHWVSGEALAEALPVSVRLLCLGTCFTAPNYQILGLSRLAHTPARYSLPTSISNRYPVTEGGVRTFWYTFYDALANTNGDTGEAFQQAQQATAGYGVTGSDWGSFSLVIRDQTGLGLRITPASPEVSIQPDATMEIQAQFAASLANQLAQAIGSFPGEPPASLSRLFDEEAARAAQLSGAGKEGP